MTDIVKIAIVGGGLIAPRHAAAVHLHPAAELVALVEPSPKDLETAVQFNTRLYTSVADLLASKDVKPDAAIVCTPNHTHVSISRDLLAAGVHVLVEKPLSHSTETARDLVQYTKENANVKLAVGHHRRFNPYMLKAKEIVSSGSLGSVMAVNGMWTLFKPDDYFEPPTDWRRLKDAGGVVLINLVHDVDLLQFLFGAIERVHVEKIARQRGDHHKTDEGAALTLRFASGVVGSFLVCDATPSPYNFEAGTGENVNIPAAPSKENFYHIFGSNASLSVPEMARWSYDGRPAKSWNQPLTVDKFDVDSSAVPYEGQLAAFLDYIAGKESSSCSAVEGLRALLVCDAVRKALDGNQTIDVELA
jgi:predicted dehydrogenase